jgi:hypothetical protein
MTETSRGCSLRTATTVSQVGIVGTGNVGGVQGDWMTGRIPEYHF